MTQGLPRVFRASDPPLGDASALLGGKGASLHVLAAAGHPVPPFVCLTTAAFDAVVAPFRAELDATLAALAAIPAGAPELAARLEEAEATLGARIRAASLPDALDRELRLAIEPLLSVSNRVAVRSSVVGEDAATDSFAGQMDTFLWVPADAVLPRALDCWASSVSKRALAYRHERRLLGRPVRAAVVVQAMIDADVSGVAFTVHPTTLDRRVVVVSAAPGLGEGIVSGLVDADTFEVDKATREVTGRTLAQKSRAVRPKVDGTGTELRELGDASTDAPCLSPAEVSRVVELACAIEARAGVPQDVEFCFDEGGALHLLQARPVTTATDDRLTVFDCSNIVESYPGISSPLTFSFVRRAYEATFREAARLLGFSSSTLERERALFENLVGLVDGRIYYNILQWYRLYQLVGLDDALPAWEKAMGLEGGLRANVTDARSEWERRAERAHIRMRIATNLFRVPGLADRYLRDLDEVRARVRGTDLDLLGGHDLLELLEECMQRLLAPYAVAVVNDFYAQQLYALLGKALAKIGVEDPDRVRDALVAGQEGMHSVEPLRSLLSLAEDVRADESLRALVESSKPPEEVWAAIASGAHPRFLERCRAHLAEFGDRTLVELKLETPSLEDEPARLVPLLRNALAAGRGFTLDRASEARAAAESEVRAKLEGRLVARAAFEQALEPVRRAIRIRENLRLARSRAFGLVKRIVRALGRLFARRGLLDRPEDIFYLDLEEVRGAVRGHLLTRELRGLVALRREAWEDYARRTVEARVATRGVVRAAPPFVLGATDESDAAELLEGQGCCAGWVEGEAKVVTDPTDAGDVAGKILVAPMTDPGWVFLMVAARGLVVERGSLLSHTAIIGRELGLPTVVAVKDATRLVRDGDVLAVDGRAGTVRIVTRREAKVPRATALEEST